MVDRVAVFEEAGYSLFGLPGHVLHSLFWQNLSPDGGDRPVGALADAIDEHLGGFEAFKKQLTVATASVMNIPWPAPRSLPGTVAKVQQWHRSRHSRVSRMKTLFDYVMTPGRPATSSPAFRTRAADAGSPARSSPRACSSTAASATSSATPSASAFEGAPHRRVGWYSVRASPNHASASQ
jgi:hypothetical protein